MQDVLVLHKPLQSNYTFAERWIDDAKYLSTINKLANVVGIGVEYNSSYLQKPSNGFKYNEVDKDLLTNYKCDLIQAETLLDIWNVYMKYAVHYDEKDDYHDDAGFGLVEKDTEVTKFINFILEYYYRVQVHIDSFMEDGKELAEVLDTNKFIDQKFLRDIVYNCINIASVNDKFDDPYSTPYRQIVYAVETPFLYLNKLFSTENLSLTKLAVNRFIRQKNYIIFKDRDSDLYNGFIKAFSRLDEIPLTPANSSKRGKIPKIAKLYLNLYNYPRTEYMLLIKDDCIQLF